MRNHHLYWNHLSSWFIPAFSSYKNFINFNVNSDSWVSSYLPMHLWSRDEVGKICNVCFSAWVYISVCFSNWSIMHLLEVRFGFISQSNLTLLFIPDWLENHCSPSATASLSPELTAVCVCQYFLFLGLVQLDICKEYQKHRPPL